MRVAVIDLGTNTFNLFIADILPDRSFRKVFRTKIPVKLGEGAINQGYIAENPFHRGIDALLEHKRSIEEYKAERVFAFATSAIRSASNGNEFVDEARRKTGIGINVISGDREAELIYLGVRQALDIGPDISLIMDIGGGSTEFIIADRERIFWKKSFLLGAARLLDKFSPSDPIREEEVKKLETYFEAELRPLFDEAGKSPVKELIGCSGSFDSLAEMIVSRFHTPGTLDGRTEYEFDLEDCAGIYDIILRSTHSQRMKMEGLVPMRVDMIVISAVFVNFIINRLGIKKMRLSSYSLKQGILWDITHS